MISTWWLIVAFVIGTYAGISLMALMYVSRRDSDDVDHLPDVAHP